DRLRRHRATLREGVHLTAAHALRRRDPAHGGEEEPVQPARAVLHRVGRQAAGEGEGLRRREALQGRPARDPAQGQAGDRRRHRQAARAHPEALLSRFWNTAERLVLRTPLRRTMLTAPATRAVEAAFDGLVQAVDAAGGAEIDYDAAAPKHAFFRFLLEHRPVLLHGTGDPAIERFDPRRQTDYDNEWTN